MLKRKIYEKLIDWKNANKKECLLIKGARQVGKTFVVKEFGEKEYNKFYNINFYEHDEYKNIFDGSLEAKDIYSKMSLYIENFNIDDGSTLIFLDEIQFCPRARTALKFLSQDKRCDVIASGSMLGLHYKEIESIPVGYEKQIEMFSLDFEEFLWALGINETAIESLKEIFNSNEKVDFALNEKFLEYINDYLIVGGMPEVVVEYLKNKNYQNANQVQNKILNSYRDDIIKYADNSEKNKILKCFDSITIQLAKENTKFQYSKIEKSATNKKYENSIAWLMDAGIIKKCFNVKKPIAPLKAFFDINSFKVYMNDIGLLTAMYGLNTQLSLKKNGIKNTGKGGIFENLAFDILNKKNKELFYYKNENSTKEIEFLYENIDGVVPVEIKSNRGKAISFVSFVEEYKPKKAYKVIYGNQGSVNGYNTIPFYMLMFID